MFLDEEISKVMCGARVSSKFEREDALSKWSITVENELTAIREDIFNEEDRKRIVSRADLEKKLVGSKSKGSTLRRLFSFL
jgi:hypothetical protein